MPAGTPVSPAFGKPDAGGELLDDERVGLALELLGRLVELAEVGGEVRDGLAVTVTVLVAVTVFVGSMAAGTVTVTEHFVV